MASAISVRIVGLEQVKARLKELADLTSDKDSRKAVSTALRRAGFVVRDEARRIVHVKSGDLQANIVAKKRRGSVPGQISYGVTVRNKLRKYKNNASNRKSGKVGQKYEDFGTLFYGRMLEFGTVKMPAYPFLAPAFDIHKGELPDVFRDELAAAIEKAFGKL
jgi:HK97 gp10 family phage protein